MSQNEASGSDSASAGAGDAHPKDQGPKLTRPANSRIAILMRDFRTNVSAVARALAADHKTEINVVHVDLAYEILWRAGMSRLPWWKRPDTEVAFGAFLVGVVFSVPGAISACWPDHPRVTVGAVVAVGVTGALIYLHGLSRGKLPS